MTDQGCGIACEVHALLTSAFPHARDINLAKAADLVSLATETKIRGDDAEACEGVHPFCYTESNKGY